MHNNTDNSEMKQGDDHNNKHNKDIKIASEYNEDNSDSNKSENDANKKEEESPYEHMHMEDYVEVVKAEDDEGINNSLTLAEFQNGKEEHERKKKERGDHFVINTGKIFIALEDTFAQYDRAFLYHVVWPAYREVIRSKGLFSMHLFDDDRAKDYLRKCKVQYTAEWGDGEKEEGFPFPDYMLTYAGTEVASLTRFADDCLLQSSDRQFDLFFTLQLLQIDLMQAQAFFEYHLKENFQNDRLAFTRFLKNISFKYSHLLKPGYVLSLQDYVTELQHTPVATSEPEMDITTKVEGFTLTRQTLFFYYLFKALNVTRQTTSVSTMAHVVQGLTGRQMGATKIKNTELYKRLANPLKDTTKGGFKEDLRFVRDQFELLSLSGIAKEINQEIQGED